nr:reverse transcriptase domain-containing protein [Tanacetum cinerariifolium]
MLRACPHHGFSELTQIDTFYISLTEQDQDSLNAATGSNLLNKTIREALKIIENKSKISNLVEIVNKQVIAPAKAVEKTYVNYGGAHTYYDCIATDSNNPSVYAATGSFNQLSPPNRASHQIPPPGFAPVQNNPIRFNQGEGNYFNKANNFNKGNNFNRGNNFQINQGYRAQMNNAPNFQNQEPALTSGNLPSNIVPNPNGEMKVVTTRSGLAYEGPSIPTNTPLEKVDEQNTEEIMEKEHSNCPGRNNFRGNNFQNNHGYRAQMNNAPNFQNQGFQNQPFLVPNNQIPSSVPNELSNYMISNEIMIKSMQNQINVLRGDFNKQEEKLRRNLNDDMRSILGSLFQNQPSTSGTLPSNTIPNPKGEMKAVTTRSSLAYEGPSIPTESPLEKVDEQNTEEILDKEETNSSRSTAQVQPPVLPIPILESDIPRTKTKPTIPYPSRLNDQKLQEKATNQMEIFFQIFHDFHFDISFADALLLMPNFASTIKSLLANKDKLFVSAKVSLNENCSAMLLKKLLKKLGDPGKFLIPCDFPELTPTRMTLELADRSITCPKGVAKDVFVKVGKFHFPTDFIVVEFEVDPRVPLILGRSFLRTGRALIDVYGAEITLRDVLDFQYNPKSSSPTLVYDDLISKSDARKVPIVKSSSPTLTPFRESDSFLEEIKDFLNDDSISIGVENFVYDPEGDILFLEKLLNEDPFQLPLMDLKLRRVNPKIHDVIKKEVIKVLDVGMIYLVSDSPWVSPIHCVPKKRGMTVVANENNELIPKRLVTGWRVCIDYRKLNDATRKGHFPLPFMDQLLERLAGNEFYCFLDGFSGYFQIPIDPQDQEKTTLTCPYGTFAYRRMPFGLCNAPGHKILKSGIEFDRAKVDVIAKLPHLTIVI